MSIPKFYQIMLPLLQKYQDSKTYHKNTFIEKIVDEFGLNPSERLEKVNSGTTRIVDRIFWAYTYLYKLGFLSRPNRANYAITARGLEFLQSNPSQIDLDKLKQLKQKYPDILEDKFWQKSNFKDLEKQAKAIESELTPDEFLAVIIEQKTIETQEEILEQIKKITPRGFENLVVKLLVAMGYGTQEFSLTTSYTADGGIDGIIQADELGFERIYVQAKKYENNVGRPDIQKFVGAMQSTSKGVFITTAKFASSVTDYLKSRQENIVLIDGQKLVELMYKYNQGVSVRQVIEIKSVDIDYFDELELA